MPNAKLKSSPVLAAAYPKGDDLKSCLTHGVELGDDGFAVRVLCKRVKFDHVIATQDASDSAVLDAAPTCHVCLKRWNKEIG
jgi:hypothetical protein